MPQKCPHCQSEVRVDLSRIPPGRAARVTCPSCSQAFPVMSDAVAPGAPTAATPAAEPAGVPSGISRAELDRLRADIEKDVTEKVLARVLATMGVTAPVAASTFDDPDDEARPALICDADPTFASAMADVLRDLGFTPQATNELKTAWRLLDKKFQLVVVTEGLADDPQAGAKILDRLSRLAGGQRRKTFALFTSDNVRTMDGGLSFVLGCNLTMHRGDIARARDILRKGLAERDKLYKPFYAVSGTNA